MAGRSQLLSAAFPLEDVWGSRGNLRIVVFLPAAFSVRMVSGARRPEPANVEEMRWRADLPSDPGKRYYYYYSY